MSWAGRTRRRSVTSCSWPAPASEAPVSACPAGSCLLGTRLRPFPGRSPIRDIAVRWLPLAMTHPGASPESAYRRGAAFHTARFREPRRAGRLSPRSRGVLRAHGPARAGLLVNFLRPAKQAQVAGAGLT